VEGFLCLFPSPQVFRLSGAVKMHTVYEGDSISKLKIVIEKNRMEIMT